MHERLPFLVQDLLFLHLDLCDGLEHVRDNLPHQLHFALDVVDLELENRQSHPKSQKNARKHLQTIIEVRLSLSFLNILAGDEQRLVRRGNKMLLLLDLTLVFLF